MKNSGQPESRTDWRADNAEPGSRHDPSAPHAKSGEDMGRREWSPFTDVETESRATQSPTKDHRFSGTRMRADAGVNSSSKPESTNRRPADVICAGMYRACSTWQYEVAAHLIDQHAADARLGYLTGEEYAERTRLDPTVGPKVGFTRWRVFKSHEGHDGFAEALASAKAIALYAYRDVRDVVFSLMHKRKLTFEALLRQGMVHQILANDRFWMKQPGLLVQRYEQILANPALAVIEIANHLGFGVNQTDAERIAAEYSLESNLARTKALKERLEQAGVNLDDQANAQICDAASLLHWNHVRKGASGSWAEEATPTQLVVLDRMYGTWLADHGYSATNLNGADGKPYRLKIGERMRIEADIQRGYAAWLIRTVVLKFPKTVCLIKSMLGMNPESAAGAKVWSNDSQAGGSK